jgi:bifunctional pyridoxal-dependent enzyme with beta-cystathionase and maltose regulon repressor activities
MKHFAPEQIQALPNDSYTSEPRKLRIVKDGDNDYPWQLDAYDDATGAYTEEVHNFATFEEAVAFIPEFIDLLVFREVTILITEAPEITDDVCNPTAGI